MNPYGRPTVKTGIPFGPHGGLDVDDLSAFEEAYCTMANCRNGHPADFVRAVRQFKILCRALGVQPGYWERAALAQRYNISRAVEHVEESLRRESAYVPRGAA